MTASAEIAPSIERSIDPIKIMKVTPIATINAGEAFVKRRAKLRTDRKFGLIIEKNAMSAISTNSGAHFSRFSRVRNLFNGSVLKLDHAESIEKSGSSALRASELPFGGVTYTRSGRRTVPSDQTNHISA